MQDRPTLSSLVLAASIIIGAAAVAGAADAQQASFCGQVRYTGRSCVTVPGSMANVGTRFDISGARPPPRRNTTVTGTGTLRGVSRCSRANRLLTNVSWRRVSACPRAR